MNWYLSKIIFQIVCGNGQHKPQFDEQLRLVHANNKDEALAKANTFGKAGANTIINHGNEMVQWKFINVPELFRLSDLIDGAEMYSQVNEVEDPESYIRFVHHKAEYLKHDAQSHQLLNLI